MDNRSDEFELLDLSQYDRNWIRRTFSDVSKQSVAKQVTIGGVSGWCAGYLFVKVGKLAAATLGTTIILLQIAQHQGYITINWKRVQKNLNKASQQMEREANRQYPRIMNDMKRFFQQNVFLAGAFAGGFFLGVAF